MRNRILMAITVASIITMFFGMFRLDSAECLKDVIVSNLIAFGPFVWLVPFTAINCVEEELWEEF